MESLCENCRIILRALDMDFIELADATRVEKRIWGKIGEVILESTELLEDSALRNCALCLLFFGMLSTKEVDAMRKHKASDRQKIQVGSSQKRRRFVTRYLWNTDYERSTVTGKRIVYVAMVHELEEEMLSTIQLTTILVDAREFDATDLMPQSLMNSTSSTLSLALAKQWLKQCSVSHEECRPVADGFLPTRLIDLGAGLKIEPRLCLTMEVVRTQDSSYLTLSHCWGSHVPQRLLKENLASLRERIVFSSLSKTFKDAFLVTKRLGYRFLWIDSLCIIQDCPTDWAKESSLMGHIYKNGTCNLAAAGAHDGTGGLFVDRNPLSVEKLVVKLKRSTDSGTNFLVLDQALWKRDVDSSPLSRRGWVFQERLLSPRTLHFGSKQLFWECKRAACCETYPPGLPTQVICDIPKALLSQDESWSSTDADATGRYRWRKVVELYSRCSLSYETDKLVAISGMAYEIQCLLRAEYCAGLWKMDIESQLLWHSEGDAGNCKRYPKYTAPTWSWASVDGPVKYDPDFAVANADLTRNRECLVDIIDVSIDLASAEVLGQVKGGHLRLRGNLAKAVLSNKSWQDLRSRNGPSYHAPLPIPYKQNDESNKSDGGIRTFPDVVWGNYATTGFRETLYILPTRNRVAEGIAGKIMRSEGLILEATGNTVNEFKRWGFFNTYTDDVQGEIQRCCAFFDTKADGSGLDFTDDERGGLKYDITIV